MAKARNFSAAGERQGEVELPDRLFGGQVHEPAMHEAVVAYLTNQRRGSSSTKGRSEVAYSGSKLFRQKGTGRARAGSARAGSRRGGGIIFGPKPRDHRIDLPKKVRRLAIRSALADKLQNDGICVVDDLTYEEPKTRRFTDLLRALGIDGRRVLLVLDGYRMPVVKSARNVSGLEVTSYRELNTYAILRADTLLITRPALERLTEASES